MAKFKVGDRVRAIGADALIGKVFGVHERGSPRPGWLYEVLLDSGTKVTAIEMDLEKVRVRKGTKSLELRAKYKARRDTDTCCVCGEDFPLDDLDMISTDHGPDYCCEDCEYEGDD
jgi:hypothetical protein